MMNRFIRDKAWTSILFYFGVNEYKMVMERFSSIGDDATVKDMRIAAINYNDMMSNRNK